MKKKIWPISSAPYQAVLCFESFCDWEALQKTRSGLDNCALRGDALGDSENQTPEVGRRITTQRAKF